MKWLTPPGSCSGRIRAGVLALSCVVILAIVTAIEWDSVTLHIAKARLQRAKKELFALEKEGNSNRPAHQILYEAEWIGSSTHDYPRLMARVKDLREALHNPDDMHAVDEQSEIDGSWGKWYTEWFFKLDASYDQISQLTDQGRLPKYPVRFLDQINSPQKLTDHLNHLLVSDRNRDGVNRRRELNETISDLMRLILRSEPSDYPYDPKLKSVFLDWLFHTARNPETGYWGARYLRHDPDKIETTDDLSITFHIISYLDGKVTDWPKVIATTLATKNQEYPNGWLEDYGYLNHNNMDVAYLFSLGWSQASPEQQAQMRVEIRKMLNWCLTESLQQDGSFKMLEGDDSVETSVTFGTEFLGRLGYFDRSKRFWTDEDFPEAEANRAKIIQFINAHKASGSEGGVYYKSALHQLGVAG